MALHVDDFMFAGSDKFKKQVIQKLVKVFEMRIQNCNNFKYVGLDIVQTEKFLKVDQSIYAKTIEEIELSREREKERLQLLSEEECAELKSVCGKLLWVANNSKPEVSFETNTMCNAGKRATVGDIVRINKLIRKVKSEESCVKFPNLGDPKMWSLAVFSDSSFANLPDGASQGGYIIFIVSADGKVAPLSWQSKKIPRITRSTLSSETSGVIEAVDAAVLLQKQIQGIFSVTPAVAIYTDSQSLCQHLHSSKILTDKSLRVTISYLRQFVNRKEITINWISSSRNLADVLTKTGAPSHQLCEVLRKSTM
jgi:hypothetical protein